MRLVLGSLLLMFTSGLFADEAAVREKLSKLEPKLPVEVVMESKVEGFYRVEGAGQEFFVNEDVTFLLHGSLYDISSAELKRVPSLAEIKNSKIRKETIASIKPSEKIIFPAKGEVKAKIAVFTDVDCYYCQKLHQEVNDLNELGIEVSYLAYPRSYARSGESSPSYKKIVSTWCAEDRLQAMTDAKAGKKIKTLSCDNPVADQFALGNAMGVSGTPAIILEDGTLIPGYKPAKDMAKVLGIL